MALLILLDEARTKLVRWVFFNCLAAEVGRSAPKRGRQEVASKPSSYVVKE